MGKKFVKFLAEPYNQNQIPRYILLTARNTPDNLCHACAPSIDGALFSKVDDEWQTTISHQEITTAGSFGQPPQQGELVQIGRDKWGFQFGWIYGSTGINLGGIILITNQANTFEVILDAQTFEYTDCEIDLPCVRFDSIVTFVEGQNPNYYDINFVSTGTRVNEMGEIVKLHP